jgi:glycogen debranching enzyme
MRAGRISRLLAGAAGLSLLAVGGLAQQAVPAPRLAWNHMLDEDAVVSRRFLAVHGRRAVIQGYASEGLEVWAYPFQILGNYRVAFRPAGASTAIEGSGILARVIFQPDAATRIYLGPNFIVREKLFVPLDRAGAILTYSVQSGKPIEIEVRATPVLNLMWPAAAGGQYIEWSSSLSAFVLAEPAGGFTAVAGSPDIAAHDNPDNRTAHGVAETGFGFTLHPAPSGVARVFVALNPPQAGDPGLLFRELIRDGETLEAEAAAHVRDVRNDLLQVETPDDRVNRAIAVSEIALDQAWVCNPDLGCGYVAGYGPSRAARRPLYEWFFAGDGLVAADAAIGVGDLVHAQEELKFILRYRDKKTGMIWHELSQSASLIDWAGKFPYMFVGILRVHMQPYPLCAGSAR